MLACTLAAVAAGPKLETTGAFTGTAPDSIKAAIDTSGYRVLDSDGKVLCELWPAKSVNAPRQTADVLFPDLNVGVFVGVVSFPQGTKDFRGQAIKPGAYMYHYALIPKDGNHMGASQDPDFLVLSPLSPDSDPAKVLKFDEIVAAGKQASGTPHPAAFAMAYPGETVPAAFANDNGHIVLAFKTKTGAGKELPLGLIVKGQAEQ